MGVLSQILAVLIKSLGIQQKILATDEQILVSNQHIEELLEAATITAPTSIKVTYHNTVN